MMMMMLWLDAQFDPISVAAAGWWLSESVGNRDCMIVPF